MRILAKFMAATAMVAMAPAAYAADFLPGDPEFTVVGNPASGPLSADYGLSGIGSGSFTDTFSFIIDQNGFGSGSIATSASGFSTNLDFTSVTFFNGFDIFDVATTSGTVELGGLSGIPIFDGALNTLTVSYLSRGDGSYGGNLTFTPDAVPEPATWALMLMGFGGLGMVMRRRRQAEAKVSYAF